jgi:hypothetical protein
MSTIPASDLVSVNPSVLAAGGDALDMIGLLLTTNSRVPIGDVRSFPSAAAVSDFFGASSDEAALAAVYFSGFDISNVKPGAMLFAQYPTSAVAAYLRGGDVSNLTLANLQALTGALGVVVDGVTFEANVNLAAAVSFSSAATIIENALNTPVSVTGSIAANVVTGAIAPNVGTASISGTTMTVSAISTGAYAPGQTISGTNVVPGTTIVAQLTGTAGSTGTYQVSISQTAGSTTVTGSGGCLTVSAVTTGRIAVGQTLSGTGVTANTTVTALVTGSGGTGKYAVDVSQTASSTTITASGGTLTVTAVSTGTLFVGDVLSGSGITAGNHITAFATGTGGTGTYLVSVGDTVGSETITVTGAEVDASYDSVSGAFVLASTSTGGSSTIAFATGAMATSLKLTSATGASLSQGSAAAAPAAFMAGVVAVSTDWVTFATAFEPSQADKLAFAAWKDTQNDRYGYVLWETDAGPTETAPDAGCTGQLLADAGDSGTCLIYAPDATLACFLMGAAASIDFTQQNGRTAFAYKAQAGLEASVTDQTSAANLLANLYNFYGAYAAANNGFVWFQNGQCTGPFAWFDSFVNQVWFNNACQLALLLLERNSKSIPYNAAGRNLIESALADPIQAGLNFGAFGPGDISAAQVAEVNTAAGADVAGTLQTQGYYLQVLAASAATRAARESPPCTLWYLDRGSVQKINLGSVAVQ